MICLFTIKTYNFIYFISNSQFTMADMHTWVPSKSSSYIKLSAIWQTYFKISYNIQNCYLQKLHVFIIDFQAYNIKIVMNNFNIIDFFDKSSSISWTFLMKLLKASYEDMKNRRHEILQESLRADKCYVKKPHQIVLQKNRKSLQINQGSNENATLLI